MAGAIFGAKVSSAQCFRGFAAETWRVAAHRRWRRWAKLAAAGCGRNGESCAEAADRSWRLAGPLRGRRSANFGLRPRRLGGLQRVGKASAHWESFTELGEVHRDVGIPGWYAGSGIHRNAEPGSGPDDFCVLGGSLRCRPLDGARPENRGPSSKASRPGRAGFSAVNRSGVREAASRTGRKNSAGAGVLGVRAHFRRKGRSCCWLAAARRRSWGGGAELAELAELLSKNCSKGWFG